MNAIRSAGILAGRDAGTTARQRGFILLPVVFAITLIAALAFLLSRGGPMALELAAGDTQERLALRVAEAGMAHALWRANRVGCTGYPLASTPFAGHSYSAGFSPTSGSPVDVTVTAALADGATRSLTRRNVAIQQAAVTVDLSAEADSFLQEDSATSNKGGDSKIAVKTNETGKVRRGVLRFGLNGIPFGARIVSASLSLYLTNSSGAPVSMAVRRLTQYWKEAEVTWNARQLGVNWAQAGGDMDLAAVSTASVGPTQDIRYYWDVTGIVAGWAAGTYANNGLIVAAASPIANEEFSSREEGDTTRRPRLSVTYACECGIECSIPYSAEKYKLLMVVGNTAGLTGNDLYKQNLLLDWNYKVTLIDDNASQAAFDSELSKNDVAFVSETVDAVILGNKLTATPIGVVYEKGALNSLFGLASGFGQTVASSVNVVDNSHEITQPFPIGTLRIYQAGMEGLRATGTLAAGAQALARWGSDAGLIALNQGAALIGGGSAPGRRVMLPLGRDSQFAYSHLNNNGRVLLYRALQWGAFPLAPPPEKNLLLVVGNPAVLTPQETLKQSWIKTWGYKVKLIDDNASQAAFDAELAANDGVYISAEANVTALSSKLTGSTRGIVNEQIQMIQQLGIGSDHQVKTRDQINIIDNTLSITQGFPLGLLTIASSAQDMYAIDTGTAPGARVLAQTFNVGSQYKDSLLTLEPGAALSGGGAAAGRRVQLPWGYGGFDVNQLNADGRLIMRRAIDWAVGDGIGGPCTLRDEFKAQNYSGSDGTLPWATDWQEVNESDGPLSGDEIVDKDQSNYQLRVQSNFGGGEGVMRGADLSAYTGAILSLDYRRDKLDDANDWVALQVSKDGGAWVELGRFAGPATDASYQHVIYDIGAYIAANTRIRLISSPALGTKDAVWFDNVQIAVSGCTP